MSQSARPARRSTPVRTCIGCRRKAPLRDLVRLVLIDGQPVVDERRSLPGRGASLHPSEACVRAALGQGALSRAFRRGVATSAPVELSIRVMAAVGGDGSRERNGKPE